jgi:hypothetical protein
MYFLINSLLLLDELPLDSKMSITILLRVNFSLDLLVQLSLSVGHESLGHLLLFLLEVLLDLKISLRTLLGSLRNRSIIVRGFTLLT